MQGKVEGRGKGSEGQTGKNRDGTSFRFVRLENPSDYMQCFRAEEGGKCDTSDQLS